MISFFQAIVLGLLQGVAELFPVSSFGHFVLIADLFGWHNLMTQYAAVKSPFLAFLAAAQIATAIALGIFYWREWVRIVQGLVRSIRRKTIDNDNDAKLAWLIVAAIIPAGLISIVLAGALRAHFATSFFAIVFIIINGVILLKGDSLVPKSQVSRPRQRRTETAEELSLTKTTRTISDHLNFARAAYVGAIQAGALLAGISRSGITMIAGLRSGLGHQDAARFSFLLATPIILGAGLYKLPGLIGTSGAGIRGQALVGALVAGLAAYLSVRYLDKYFQNRSLRPFGFYCIGLGIFMLLVAIVRGAG